MTAIESRIFAVIPAAGLSRRMGEPKLLLRWGDSTVIEQLIRTLSEAAVAAVVVVVRPDDLELQRVIEKTSAIVIVPDHAPPHMRDSVEIGLFAIRERFQPRDDDAWLLVPADHPLVEADVLGGMLARWNAGDCEILLPKFGDRRGHPTLLRWSLAMRVFDLPRDCGVNALLHLLPQLVTEWPTERESVLADLDTPEDYRRWQQTLGGCG